MYNSEKYKLFYAENKEVLKARNKKYWRRIRKDKPAVALWKAAKRRANLEEKDFDIEIGDILIPKICPVLGIPIIPGDRVRSPNLPSLDRTDNNGGYTKDNIQVISYRANTLKSDMTLEEARLIYEHLSRRGS